MLALLMTIAGGIDWKDAAVPLMEVSALAFMIYLMYVLFMTFCVLNVVTGIFCQCAVETAQQDRENVIRYQLEEKENYVKTLKALFEMWDDNGNGKCTVKEFENHLHDPETRALLGSLDIQPRDAVALFDMLDADGSGEIDLDEFITGCITLRGGAKAIHLEKAVDTNNAMASALKTIEASVRELQKKRSVHDASNGSSLPPTDNRLGSIEAKLTTIADIMLLDHSGCSDNAPAKEDKMTELIDHSRCSENRPAEEAAAAAAVNGGEEILPTSQEEGAAAAAVHEKDETLGRVPYTSVYNEILPPSHEEGNSEVPGKPELTVLE